MDKIVAAGMLFFFMMILAAGISAIAALPFMFCWNNAVTHVFHAPEISWFQSWCLLYIVSCMKTTVSNSSN